MQYASLTNRDIAELLAIAAETAKQPLQKSLRRASRRAFLWPEEASHLVEQGRSLEEFQSVGPYLSKLIGRWIEEPPAIPEVPDIRKSFFTVPETQALVEPKPSWLTNLKGDLQMHTQWSDGSGSIEQMAESAIGRGYEYIAITDHSKGLKKAGGINEEQLREQACEIAFVNDGLAAKGRSLRVIHAIELNLNPSGQGDMDESSLSSLDLVLGCFHSALRKKDDHTERYLAALRNPAASKAVQALAFHGGDARATRSAQAHQEYIRLAKPGALATPQISGHIYFFCEDFLRPLSSFIIALL